jgi:2-polyprenyl-6-methoxyphenol hydroxylase-like FAD-dependent oxidoreductase
LFPHKLFRVIVQALDTIGCADALLELGIKAKELAMNDRSSQLISGDFSSLAAYTRYPFALLLPQNKTEAVLGKTLRNLEVKVFRPFKVTAMKSNPHEADTLDVFFETGEVIQASYVIGADGARSVVRSIRTGPHAIL